MDRPPPVVCTGRALDDRGRATGGTCGRTFKAPPRIEEAGIRPPTAAEQDSEARAAGWRIGPTNSDGHRHAMCPRCAKPDPTTTALCRDLDRSTT